MILTFGHLFQHNSPNSLNNCWPPKLMNTTIRKQQLVPSLVLIKNWLNNRLHFCCCLCVCVCVCVFACLLVCLFFGNSFLFLILGFFGLFVLFLFLFFFFVLFCFVLFFVCLFYFVLFCFVLFFVSFVLFLFLLFCLFVCLFLFLFWFWFFIHLRIRMSFSGPLLSLAPSLASVVFLSDPKLVTFSRLLLWPGDSVWICREDNADEYKLDVCVLAALEILPSKTTSDHQTLGQPQLCSLISTATFSGQNTYCKENNSPSPPTKIVVLE